MAKTSSIAKQQRRERLVKLKWDKRQQLKKIVTSIHSTHDERMQAQAALNKLPKNSSPVRLRNRCRVTGRARGFLRKFQLSRLTFREFANSGMIPGVVKASW